MGRAIRLLLFLHGWVQWEQIVKGIGVSGSTELEEQMSNKRCDLCYLFGCRHVNPRLPAYDAREHTNLSTISAFPIGERIGDAMESFSGVVVDNPLREESEKRHSTIPMGPASEMQQQRVIIPPPPPLPTLTGSTVNKELQKIDMKNDWVHCNLCKARVCIIYLDNHLKVHTHDFEPSSITSTAIVRTNHTGAASAISSSTSNVTSYKKPEEKKGPSLSKIESYKFRQLEQACAASSVSNDGRYSDFTVIFWEREKISPQSTVYSGGNTSYTSKDWERFSIHIVYDKLEDYYTITSKLLRRASYSSFDNEDTIPDRICFQEELATELKRALLFFRISPRSAYKHFRKLFSQPLVTDYDNDGRALITQTKNCETLQERMKKAPTGTWQGHNGHGWDHEYD